ncbi:hypothetical protein L6164_002004 [Bauhinia variegata]|uniref:Uncharacterized protein n=1 Tax=Bauhinia variegata TaxID=167791 RepID=A0ACB9PZM5_BAUVA|nr:hypothetical protein L6164_002004 [Bauhinia variegata]
MITMGETQKEVMWEKEEEEEAQVSMWKYIFGFSEMAVVRCAIDLKIADAIESHGSPMTLSQLSSTLDCDSSLLLRIMRFLIHRKIFKEIPTNHGSPSYAQTPLSAPFEKAHGEDFWSYSAANHGHSEIFNEAMASDTRFCVPMIIERCAEAFDGVNTVVDVAGGNGTAMGVLVKACPWIKAINFDCPHVVSAAKTYDGVEHVGGDMFPEFLKQMMSFLRKCREAIPKENGRVIIVDAVIDEDGNKEDRFKDVKLMVDMVMMAPTTMGKEREWD